LFSPKIKELANIISVVINGPCSMKQDIKLYQGGNSTFLGELSEIINKKEKKREKFEKHKKIVGFSPIALLRHCVLLDFVSFCVLVFVRAILSWFP